MEPLDSLYEIELVLCPRLPSLSGSAVGTIVFTLSGFMTSFCFT